MNNNKKREFGTVLVALVVCIRTLYAIERLMEVQSCNVMNNNTCVVVCLNWNGSQNDVDGLKNILEAEGKKNKTCSLIFERCTFKSEKINLWEDLNRNSNIDTLKIMNSLTDVNELNLKIFKNIYQLMIKNTTTANLQRDMFHKLPNLRRLQLQGNKFLQKVEKGFLQNLTLDYFQIQGLQLNQTEMLEFFQNLTAALESQNNFEHFHNPLLEPPSMKVMLLTNCYFENGGFNNGNFTKVYVDGNEIQTLPEIIFRPLIAQIWLPLEENLLTCDYEMHWMREAPQENCTIPDGKYTDVQIRPERKSSIFSKLLNESSIKLNITNDNPECFEVNLPETTKLERAFLWYGDYENMTFPHFQCLKILNRKLTIKVKPNVNYLVCLATGEKNFQIDINGCVPIKTRPHHEDQPWLTKKSIPLSIISIFVGFLFALATGALILYLSVRKNPSLIRGSKRVIEVKRHDKAQILIMPRGYEPVSQEGSPLALPAPRFPLEPSRSYDTISTVSYVSANQPTQLEILSYRFNRLRELFQRSSVPSFFFSNQVLTPVNRRLPPNVDLLLEYEWYTITTTTTTQV